MTDELNSRMDRVCSHTDASDRCAKDCEQAKRLIARLGLPLPYVYMSDSGSVRIEWTFPGGWDVDIDYDGANVTGDATNTATGETHDFELAPGHGRDAVDDDTLAEFAMALLRSAGWRNEPSSLADYNNFLLSMAKGEFGADETDREFAVRVLAGQMLRRRDK